MTEQQVRDIAYGLMNKQFKEDEYHMYSKGVQAMAIAILNELKQESVVLCNTCKHGGHHCGCECVE